MPYLVCRTFHGAGEVETVVNLAHGSVFSNATTPPELLTADALMVFAPNRGSHLLRLSTDSTLPYAAERMDEVSYPNVVYSADSRSFQLNPVRRLSTFDLAVANGKVCCYSYPASSSHRVIDVYRYTDGRYQYSFKLPVEFRKVQFTEHHLSGLETSQVTVWRWERKTTP